MSALFHAFFQPRQEGRNSTKSCSGREGAKIVRPGTMPLRVTTYRSRSSNPLYTQLRRLFNVSAQSNATVNMRDDVLTPCSGSGHVAVSQHRELPQSCPECRIFDRTKNALRHRFAILIVPEVTADGQTAFNRVMVTKNTPQNLTTLPTIHHVTRMVPALHTIWINT